MNDFEDLLEARIPWGEAASYFIGIKKFAADDSLTDARKKKMVDSLYSGQRSALHTAARKAQLEKFERGKQKGDVAGRVSGALAGGAAAALGGGKHRALAGAAGAAVGQHLGGHVGRHLGAQSDVKKWRAMWRQKKAQEIGTASDLVDEMGADTVEELEKKTKKRIIRAPIDIFEKRARFKKRAEDLLTEETPIDSALSHDPEEAPQEAPIPAAPPQETGVDHVKAELLGSLAEKAQEAEYYKQVAQQATQQATQAQQAAQVAQQAADTVQQQVQQVQVEAQQVGQAAVASAAAAQTVASQAQKQQLDSMNESMAHKQLSANMRAGIIALKQRVMEAVQSDPTPAADQTIGAPPVGAPPPMMPPGGPMPPGPMPPEAGGPPPMPPEAMPPGAAPPGAAPQAAPPPAPPGGAAPPPGVPPAQMKTASLSEMASFATPLIKQRLPYAAAGAALGAGAMLHAKGRQGEGDRKRVAELEAAGGGGFGKSMQLAKAKMQLAINEVADANPNAAIAAGALMGAGTAVTAGPKLVGAARRGYKLYKG